MLTTKNKTAIDKSRDILVNKIPSPEGQIEQITMAMLYKFMDDMDQESILLGGKAKFFSDEYEKYSWRKIMSKTIGAQERYNLYTDALERFYVHPTIEPMFREIFKGANLPFKEADTLTMFLREVDEGFSYSDSETLGDAYEYLLADQNSQRGLGQFRTPRHIIDFITEIVDPKKKDTILDPACGTAGFLISAFKHIQKENTKDKPGDKLNYDEKIQVLKHLTGYDIEPKMVKIARMNMFLHGATIPDIQEYDSLTMDSNWNERFNVILANPPFMTPGGGIKPHRKFNITSKKSEILFVDYIQSHLRENGRAGIIVPDGVTFKNEKAFLEERKTLIDNSLWAVVSLPSGIFKPYSGVSTCILLLDKKMAQIKKEILFVELSNDGFSLGDQRKPVEGNEIPELTKIIKDYQKGIKIKDSRCFTVSKEKIAQNFYDLSINKYKKEEIKEIEYEDPKVISNRIINRQKEILDIINTIKGQV